MKSVIIDFAEITKVNFTWVKCYGNSKKGNVPNVMDLLVSNA